ncbi:hypothetical protein FJV41_16135 [Myxococcus llanfairpwllgwyngyllgogerychwyrndrobwllllantysiliogogogochensis]|uniref:Peptidase M41 domain-containing protein n=1 Tax=Myxococcus llanfairpwllgwyngyllgogerychwyrndrobwllllantysiliogogogochensis TaxID=2590453 RepID=A0A540X0Z3_9BACT|nr:hypothetical protein [Myxococcus llanfairpwllgwyngyllgogerychwyrndrobwllllantysiliogogogochensis]TQF14916.1 hypothetical protein FJV41_16135 [Myxococcus llanfairpwllgwyngyllgogerychwyrndrobwllllantysiliogogogochensis]
MIDFVVRRDPNRDLERALIPGAKPAHLMKATGKIVPDELARSLTLIHESAHAVLATVLRGSLCTRVSVNPRSPATETVSNARDAVAGNEDLIDLAGLYAEIRVAEGELGYSHQHIQNAMHDLEKARARLNASEDEERRWGDCYRPLAMAAIEHFWRAIERVANALADKAELTGAEVEALVKGELPTTPLPDALQGRLKPGF